jgi:hypothetical protein
VAEYLKVFREPSFDLGWREKQLGLLPLVTLSSSYIPNAHGVFRDLVIAKLC